MSVTADRSDACAALTREGDRDAYVATLFAPAEKRPALFALHAFRIEIASVRDKVRDPLPGEVRLQWWRDFLEGSARGDVTAHPLAAALTQAIERHRLPVKPLLDLIEARTFDLYDDPMPTIGDFEGYAGEVFAAPVRLASLILAEGADPGPADAAGHAGVAMAVAAILADLPRHRARGQVFVPLDILTRHGLDRDAWLAGEAASCRAAIDAFVDLGRRHLARFDSLAMTIPTPVMPAFLTMAAVRLRLSAGTRPVATWRRMLAIWRMARRFG